MLTVDDLHEDAQVAALVWMKLLPPFAGKLIAPCGRTNSLAPRVMNRSLALIHSASPFRDAVNMSDVWSLLKAYDEDLVNWEDVFEALRSTLA